MEIEATSPSFLPVLLRALLNKHLPLTGDASHLHQIVAMTDNTWLTLDRCNLYTDGQIINLKEIQVIRKGCSEAVPRGSNYLER